MHLKHVNSQLPSTVPSTTFILTYKLILVLSGKLLWSSSAHFLKSESQFSQYLKENLPDCQHRSYPPVLQSLSSDIYKYTFSFFHSVTAMPDKSRCLQGWAGIAVPCQLVLRRQNQTLRITQAGGKVIRPFQEE